MINFTILGLRRLHKLQIQVDLESTLDATGIYPCHQMHKKKIGMNDTNPNAVNDITNAIKSSLERAKL